MKTLIFGATGATGKHIVKHAVAAQDQVYVFVRDVNKIDVNLKEQVTAIQGDMKDKEAVSNAVKQAQPEAIIIASGHMTKQKDYRLNSLAVPVIVQTLQELDLIDKCRLLFLGGLFTPPRDEPLSLLLKSIRFVFVNLFYNWSGIQDNIDTINYLMYETNNTGLSFTVIRMGYVVEEESKGTLIPAEDSTNKVTFGDMGLFLVKLAHGEYRDETVGKAIKVTYQSTS